MSRHRTVGEWAALGRDHIGAMPIKTQLGYPEFMELTFEIRDAEEGGYHARALGYSIFTEAETWADLRANLIEAVSSISKMLKRVRALCECTT